LRVGGGRLYTEEYANVAGKAAPDPELTCCTVPSQIVPAPTKIFKDIAPFTQALMLKMLPNRFDHRSASVCRLRF
jgi:hypothetical protein